MNFFDDLNKLNQGTEDKEFSDLNNEVYDEHNYILSLNRNPEFFKGLFKMFYDYKIYHKNTDYFLQEDLNKIFYIDTNPKYYGSYFNKVTSLDELKYFKNLKKIYSWGFSECRKLKSIIFPENLKIIHHSAFDRCISLKELIFPKNIQIIEDNAFIYCNSLEKIIIPKVFKNDIEDIFAYVDLTNVNITYI